MSVQSDNASEYYPEDRPDYYSGLDASSDEDDSGESASILDEMDDIPVTGFAVASNKRNADFHELFPNIPEGDYLIEGARSASYLVHDLTILRLWLCSPARNLDTRSPIYFRKPYMLSCQHLRLDH